MPSKDFLSSYEEQPQGREARSVPRNSPSSHVRGQMTGLEAWGAGADDTLSWGFADEVGSFFDTVAPDPYDLITGGGNRQNIWQSDKSFGELFESNRQPYLDAQREAEEEHFGAYTFGQIAGAFIPFGNKAAAAAKSTKGLTGAALREARASSVRQIVGTSALYGGIYGFGSADGDLGERAIGAVNGAASGAIGGYLLGGVAIPLGKAAGQRVISMFARGKDVHIDPAKLPLRAAAVADEADDVALSVAPKAAPKKAVAGLSDDALSVKVPVKSVSDDLPDGAVITARELLGEPGAVKAAMAKRLGKMSPVEAQKLLSRIEDAQLNGTVVDDPHYRSLLNLDLGDTKLTADELLRAADNFETATAAIAERAGLGAKTLKGMEQAVGQELKKGLTLADLEDAYEKSKNGYIDVRKAQHVVFATTAAVIRLREEMLPQVLNGVEGARDKLADELSDLAYRFTFARGIMSNAGRNLGILSHGAKARTLDVADDVFEIESADAIRRRVNASLAAMDDAALSEMLSRIRTMADADKLQQVLSDPVEAAAFSAWNRTLNSVGLFLRSNALTPATGLFNTAGFVLNDLFRNDLGKLWAARSLARDGRTTEAALLKMEHSVGRAVYWEAQKRGLKALLKRVQWEAWTDVERIASVGWGKGVVAAKAQLKRTTMLKDGFVAPELREFKERARLNVTDTAGFNAGLEEARAGGGALANLVYHLQRARAVTANTVDAAGSASMKLFTGAIDDWGREFVRVKETYAQATRFAFREAYDAGVPEDRVGAYVSARAKELAELPNADLLQRVEAAMLASDDKLTGEAAFLRDLHKVVEKEADKVLFMDGPKTKLGKASANLLEFDRIGLVLPYVRTPIRLFEQGVVNYGPLAGKSREIQDILRRGELPTATPDEKLAAAVEAARVEVGTMVFQAGLMLGLVGAITATNGGFENSAGLDAGPPNRINLPGGGFVEFGRVDPFAFTVGMGAMLGQAYKAGLTDASEYDQQQALQTGAATAFFAARDSILDKSYLKGLEDIMEVFTAGSLDESVTQLEKILGGAAGRLVPLGGISRQVQETFSPSAVESVGIMDAFLRHIPGAGWGMAPRVDPLGDEVKGRTMGLNFGSSELSEGEPISDVKRQLRELGINITTIRKSDPDGYDLNSEELSELRKIRAKEAVNPQGLTMHEALGDLFADPWFQGLPSKDQKRAEIVETMREFNKPAYDILAERDPGFDAKRAYTKSLADYIAEGLDRQTAEDAALEDTVAQGLPEPDL